MPNKITLADTKSGYNRSTINNNFQKIQEELNNKVLYRDNPAGEPNQLENDLDANSNRITNLPSPVSDHEPATKAYVDRDFFTEAQGYVDEAEALVGEAEDARDAANGSATAAANSASDAATSAGNAATSENNAAMSATQSAESALESASSAAEARDTVDSLNAGTVGFDADIYDFGFIVNTPFITRDYGALV